MGRKTAIEDEEYEMNQRELKARIKNDPNLTSGEKAKRLREVAVPYRKLSDEELLQLVRDFVAENNRMPERCDLLYDTVLKERFGPWGRMLEKAGVKEVAQSYLDRRRRRKEKRERHKEDRRQIREQQAADTARTAPENAETAECAEPAIQAGTAE